MRASSSTSLSILALVLQLAVAGGRRPAAAEPEALQPVFDPNTGLLDGVSQAGMKYLRSRPWTSIPTVYSCERILMLQKLQLTGLGSATRQAAGVQVRSGEWRRVWWWW